MDWSIIEINLVNYKSHNNVSRSQKSVLVIVILKQSLMVHALKRRYHSVRRSHNSQALPTIL